MDGWYIYSHSQGHIREVMMVLIGWGGVEDMTRPPVTEKLKVSSMRSARLKLLDIHCAESDFFHIVVASPEPYAWMFFEFLKKNPFFFLFRQHGTL